VWEALKRLLFHSVEIEPSVWAFAVMVLSIVVDWGRSRALSRVAKKYNSQALEADALHFSTDIWSSLVVIFGLALVAAGRAFQIPELMVADPLAAIAVSGLVAHISLSLGKRTVDALLDAAPAALRAKVAEEVMAVEGVLNADRVRLRHAGNRYFVDAKIAVRRTATLEQAKAVSDAVQARIQGLLPESDVLIHAEPRAQSTEDLFERVKAVATRHKVNVHDLSIFDSGEEGLHLDLHLEVEEHLTLREAHDLVSRVEEEITREAPGLASINSHIENAGAHIEPAARASERSERMIPRLRQIAESQPHVRDCHEMAVRLVRDRLYVSCHCLFDGDLPIATVHEVTAEVEAQFRREFPEIFRVLIHSEPAA
jgi:divalent metal cation (Fe/Co/Zn/Cd) transporter